MERILNFDRNKIIILTSFLFSLFIINYPFETSLESHTLGAMAVASFMFSMWVTESLPIPITSLIPLIAFPLLGVLDIDETAKNYANKIIFLFLSGFLVAIAMQKWGLSKRISLNILKFTGNSSKGIILGFMIATSFLSMWISNTATTIMMLPIAFSILQTIKNQDSKDFKKFAKVLLIAIAYSASIGGIATIIGTPPNAIFVSYLNEALNYDFHFSTWFKLFFPLSMIILTVMFFYLTSIVLRHNKIDTHTESGLIKKELKKLGKISFEEKAVTLVFLGISLSWVFKNLFPFEIDDSSIGILGCIFLFLIPCSKQKGFLLSWKEDSKLVSWGTLLLFGGGLTLAKGLEAGGVIEIIGNFVQAYSAENLTYGIIAAILIAIFATEFMSNIALTAVIVPILVAISLNFSGSPFTLSLPATVAASCAFMLPMATPPNAIIFSSKQIKIKDMIKIGFSANLISFAIILVYSLTVL
jgi:sodium-dependent dicarboxylate transporter 2/3/5